jgi:hypothetical protein
MARLAVKEVIIPSGSTTSDVIILTSDSYSHLYSLKGIIFPSSMTGSTITYRVATNNTDTPVLLNGVSTTVAVNNAVSLDASVFTGWGYVQFVSNASEAANRTLKILMYDV